MDLHRTAHRYYRPKVTTTQALTQPWRASFDAGVTWKDSAVLPDGIPAFLVAGPDDTLPGAATVLPLGDTRPLLRCDEGSERIIVEGPTITVR